MNERTMLQHIGEEKLGIIVDRSPKCTPEIAVKGIEYCWAMSKGWYRVQPLEKKKGKDSFHKLVQKSVGPSILSLERSRMFSRRAREYMVAYHMLEQDGTAATPVNLSHIKKERKSHTEVQDIQTGWVTSVLRDIIHGTSNIT